MLKKILFVFIGLILALAAFCGWFFSLLESGSNPQKLSETKPHNLDYLTQAPTPTRGKILAVVTSTNTLGKTGKYTGYELTELARAYYVFLANGFEVDIASPKGGEPPVVIDGDDMGKFDYAFLNDVDAQNKVTNSIPVSEVDASSYQALYFVGGKGAMFDFPDNKAIQMLVRDSYESGKVVSAVCHGPAALLNVTLSNGENLLAGKTVSSFTNAEELFLIPDARTIFPYLLEDELGARGATFRAGPTYLENIVQDESIITGQNPWSVWTLAEKVIQRLGYTPVKREITAEENSVAVLLTLEMQGYKQAEAQMRALLASQPLSIDRNLIAMHSIVSTMQGRVGKSLKLISLVRQAKKLQH